MLAARSVVGAPHHLATCPTMLREDRSGSAGREGAAARRRGPPVVELGAQLADQHDDLVDPGRRRLDDRSEAFGDSARPPRGIWLHHPL